MTTHNAHSFLAHDPAAAADDVERLGLDEAAAYNLDLAHADPDGRWADVMFDEMRAALGEMSGYDDVAHELEALADVDDEDIAALCMEAYAAGDLEQVAVCRAAIAGDTIARAECVRVIEDARAQLDD